MHLDALAQFLGVWLPRTYLRKLRNVQREVMTTHLGRRASSENATSICRISVRGRLRALETHLDRQPSSDNAKQTIYKPLDSEPVRTTWDYVYRRFGLTTTENTTKLDVLKPARLSDLISLDACRSKRINHPAGNQPTPYLRNVQREVEHAKKDL